MFEDVIVGVDGRQGGCDAIALAGRLAAPGANVKVAHVYGVPVATSVSPLVLPAEMEGAKRLVAHAIDRARFPAEPATIYDSSVGRGFHRLAEQTEADLIVIGSCHRGALGRTFLGDDASRTLHGARCAVAIAPRGYAASSSDSCLSRIGVGCAAAPMSRQVLDIARTLAAHHHATIRALSVVSRRSIRDREPALRQWPQVAGQLVVDELHHLSELEGIEADATYGDPGEMLAEFSATVDVLIIDSPGRVPTDRHVDSSTADYLVRHAHCPIVILAR